MNFNIIAIGKKMPDWVEAGVADYQKRFAKPYLLKMTCLTMEKRQKQSNIAQLKQKESRALLEATKPSDFVIALDERGKSTTTMQLAEHMKDWQHLGKDIAFLIGGPDGLDQHCLSRANQVLSLSKLTLPHPLVRIVLVEQLYRALMILQNHPYHRA